MLNALNSSVADQSVVLNDYLDEEDLLTDIEINDKERTVRNLMYKAEINLAVCDAEWKKQSTYGKKTSFISQKISQE